MSLNESIEIVREALKNEIPSDKEFLALHELVSLAHIKIINAEIDKIKSDNKQKNHYLFLWSRRKQAPRNKAKIKA